MNLVGKYLEISGKLAGRIEMETEDEVLVRKAMKHKLVIELNDRALFVSKKIFNKYWIRAIDLPKELELRRISVDSEVAIKGDFYM